MSATLKSLQRFIVIGLIATLIHYTTLRIALGFGLILAVANTVGFLTSLGFSYAGNRYFVFASKSGHGKAFTLVCVGYGMNWFIHTGLMVGFTAGIIYDFFDLYTSPIGQIIAMPWRWIATILPDFLSNFIFSSDYVGKIQTTPTFIFATGFVALITYFWNRFVVFEMRPENINK